MAINLSKGQKVDLTKGNPSLKNIMVGLGWDVNAFDGGYDFDLDASAFVLGANGLCPTDKDFIFYGNLKHASGAVEHMGDNLTGSGDGDDEQILVDLSKIPANIGVVTAPTGAAIKDIISTIERRWSTMGSTSFLVSIPVCRSCSTMRRSPLNSPEEW